MSVSVPLPVYPAATPERVAVLRAAKASIDTDVKVVPVNAEPGSPGAVFAFGERPNALTEYVLVRPDGVEDVSRVAAALEFWLAGGKTHDEADWLGAVMGCGVTFVGTEPYAPKVSF